MFTEIPDPARRRILRSLSAGALGLGLGPLFSLEKVSADSGKATRQARNVLVIYEEGGISQMDT